MALFEAKVRNRQNKVVEIRVQAADEAEARARLRRSGQVITMRRKAHSRFTPGLSEADRQILLSRLSAMLHSRVGTSQALALIRDTFTGRIQEVAGRLLGYVEAGSGLAEAMAQVGSPDFPEASLALIQAGSRSGDTHRALRDAATFEYELHNVRKSSSRGLWGGIGSFAVAAAVTLVSAFYLGPATMNSQFMSAVNQSAQGGVNIGWVNHIAFWIGVLMAGLAGAGVALWLLSAVGRRIAPVAVDSLILKIPFYKDLVLAKNNFIVLYGLELLVRSGVKLEEAFRLSAESAPRGALRADLQAANKAVKAGQPWPAAMRTLHPTDRAALASAVDREQISRTLGALATQYRELYAQRLASFVPLLNLLSALFLSLAGGILFGETILPLLMAGQNIAGG